MMMMKFMLISIMLIGIIPNNLAEHCASRRPMVHLERAVSGDDITKKHGEIITEWLPLSAEGQIAGEFFYSNGFLTVPETGMYYVYCQVYFHRSPASKPPRFIVILKDRTLFLGQSAADKKNTAYSGGIFKLNRGDNLHVKLFSPWGTTVPIKVYMGQAHTFFGAYML